MVNLRCESSTAPMLLLYLSETKLFSHKLGFQFYPYPKQSQRINVLFLKVHYRVNVLKPFFMTTTFGGRLVTTTSQQIVL